MVQHKLQLKMPFVIHDLLTETIFGFKVTWQAVQPKLRAVRSINEIGWLEA
jgi:hypothetical protein